MKKINSLKTEIKELWQKRSENINDCHKINWDFINYEISIKDQLCFHCNEIDNLLIIQINNLKEELKQEINSLKNK